MALTPILSSLDGLDETVQSHYAQQDDGSFRLDVTPTNGWALEDVTGLKASYSDQKERRKRLQEQIDGMKDGDGELPTAGAMAKLHEQLTALRDATPRDKVEEVVSQRVAEAKERHDRALAKAADDLAKSGDVSDGLKAKLNKLVVEGAAVAAITKAGASESVKMLLPIVMSQLGIDGLDGDEMPHVFVRGSNGVPRLTNGTGTDQMGVDELLSEMSESPDFARAFPGTGATGAGAGQPGTAGGSVYTINASDLRDQKKYQAAKVAAEEAGQQLQVRG